MRISERLKSGRATLSFEFFPPKDDIGFWDLYRTVESLRPLNPDYVSVTCGTGHSTRRKTLDLTARIKSDIGIEALVHLTCAGCRQEEIARELDELRFRGIENILALRGDPAPGDSSYRPVEGGFRHANELVAFIRDRYDLCIGAACYPEKHPEAPSLHEDIDNLRRKVDAGVDFLITQLFFENEDFFRFQERIEQAGIGVPLIAGVMPILSVGQIKKFTQICGVRIPHDLLRKIEAVEDDPEAVRHIGMYHTTRQCLSLIERGVAGVHFYTLNRSTATRAIYQFIKASM
jgi:methylenetetrahydrofolate reductase (NADPH)